MKEVQGAAVLPAIKYFQAVIIPARFRFTMSTNIFCSFYIAETEQKIRNNKEIITHDNKTQ